FGRALLAVVELLDHLHRQEYVVLLELEQRGRVVHQHVGVEHVDALALGHRGLPSPGWWSCGQGRTSASRGAGQWRRAETGGITSVVPPSVRRTRPARGQAP